jgi:hypothetical protein
MSAILFHRSPQSSILALHTNLEERLMAFRRLNEELRRELGVTLTDERRTALLAEHENATS